MSKPRTRKCPEHFVVKTNSRGKRYFRPCSCCRIITFKRDHTRDLRTRKQNEKDSFF